MLFQKVCYMFIQKVKHWLVTAVMLMCGFVVRAHNGLVDGPHNNILSDINLAMEGIFENKDHNSHSDGYYEVNVIINGTFDAPNQKSGWTDGLGEMTTGNHNNWTNVNGGFVEKWVSYGSSLGNLDFYQEISGLPSGTYSFAVYVIACQQSLDDSFEVSGVKVYANTDSVSVHTINVDRDETNRAIGPELIMVTTTIVEGETLKVGISVANTDANWIAMDNAKLYAAGDAALDLYKEDLKTLLTAAASIEPIYSAGAKEQLDQAVAEGNIALNTISQEQVIDAIQALEKAIARAERSVEISTVAFSTNTVVSLTQFLENPNMDNGTIDGWTTTEGWQYQGNTHSGNGSEISRFQEHWIWSGGLGNTSTIQILQDLPNGKYLISADVVATAQYVNGDAKESTTGVYWIVNRDSVAVATYNSPEKIFVETMVTDGTIRIEFAGVNTTANWMAFDNVELIYCREGSDAELIKEGWTFSDGHLVIYRNFNFGNASSYPWYSQREQIISVEFSSSVTSIGNYAFSNCNGLKEVILADGSTPLTLGNKGSSYGLFYSCPLETVYLGRNLNYTSTSYSCFPFYNKDNLTNVTIGNSVTSINSYAFYDCDNLSTLTIPSSVTSIGSHAFYGSGLTSITLPESITGISEYTFSSCDKLTSITLPESLTNIGEYAFENCSNLSSITIPKNVTTIGYYAFGNCTGELIVNCNIPSAASYSNGAFYGSDFSRVVIGEDVTTIGSNAFYYSDKLTTVFLSEDVTSIGEGAFYGCNNLYTVINRSSLALSVGSSDNGYVAYYAGQVLQGDDFETLGDFLFSDGTLVAYLGNDTAIELPKHYKNENYGIGSRVFYNNTKLISVGIPEGVTGIGSYAFYGCNKLASVRIPEGVTSVGEYAFHKCTGLTSLIIPESVVEIGKYAFRYCTGEAMVNCNIPSASSYSEGAFYDSDFSTIAIGGDVTAIGDYAFYNCNNLTSVTLPEGLRSIGNSSFYDCYGLASIDIPDDVVEIGYNAFEYCSSLTAAVIPEGVTSVKNATFANCSKLATVNLSKDITEIGYHAFYNCNSLSSITIPKGVTLIGGNAFYGCSNLLELTIPEGVTNISEYTFAYCDKLSSVTLPDGVTSIGSNAFYACKSLSSIELPNGVTSIGDNAFCNCSSLAAMTIPEGVTIINNSIFSGCKNLAEITLPEGITSIGSSAFSECNKLASIIIPESVTSIGSSAFYNCDSLVSMAIPENVTSIGTYAFEGCNSLVSVTIPDKVKTLDRYLFQNCSALATVTVGTGVETIRSYVLYNCNLNALLCYAIIPPSIQSNSFYQSTISAIYVPSASVELYRAADVWKDYNILAISDYTANLLTVSYEYGVGVTTVSLDASLNNSKIYYTLDGSDPLSAGILYEAPFEVNSACTLKAIAVCSGFENSNLIDERIVIKNMPTINNFSLSYTRDITYDGAPHDVYVYASNGMGEITLVYRDANGMESTEAPSAVGKYDVSISVAEGPLFYAASFENVASFTISVMDEVEWNTLQELYVQTNGASQWTRKWDMSGGIAAAASFYGVTYRNGHVVELSLSNRNLVGQLPISVLTLPYLERLNLSRNQLTGDLGSLVAGTESISNLSYIDISNNRFSGNIGTIVTCCPKLEYLYAAHNYISEVSPALPEDLYVSLSSQTVEDMLVWDGGVSVENSDNGLPTILTYRHRNQNYNSADLVVEKAWNEDARWSINMSVDAEGDLIELSAQAENYVYYGNSGDTLDVTTSTTMTAYNSIAKMIYRFELGDVNFSDDVDVLDVQSTINFIFKEFQYYPFNHTAANVQNGDSKVNVLDVIALIDQLMNENLSVESLARARAKGRAAMAADAYLYWEGNRLILETEKEVAALDIVLQETNSLQWNESLGMTMTSSAQNGYQRAIAYSLSGRYIPIGKHVLLTSQPCDIASVLVADRAAQKIGVALKASETTGIEKENTERLHCRQQGSWVQLIVDAEYDQLVWEAYTTAGCLMGSGILEDVTEGIVNLFATDSKRTMIVVVRDNNGIVLTQKLK